MTSTNKKERECLKWKSINQLKTSYDTKVRFCPMLCDVLKSIVLFDGSQSMPRPAFSSNKNGSIEVVLRMKMSGTHWWEDTDWRKPKYSENNNIWS